MNVNFEPIIRGLKSDISILIFWIRPLTDKEKKRQLWAAYYPRKRETILRRVKLRNKRKQFAKMQIICEKITAKMGAAIQNSSDKGEE